MALYKLCIIIIIITNFCPSRLYTVELQRRVSTRRQEPGDDVDHDLPLWTELRCSRRSHRSPGNREVFPPRLPARRRCHRTANPSRWRCMSVSSPCDRHLCDNRKQKAAWQAADVISAVSEPACSSH